MRKILPFFIIATVGLLAFFVFRQKPATTLPPSTLPSPAFTPVLQDMQELIFNDQTYRFAFTIIKDIKKLNLYPNFNNKVPVKDLINNCPILVSGGFYDQENQPIGWLVSNSQVISQPVISRLFNGYLSVTDEKIQIQNIRPQTSVFLGLQSGPLLIQNHQVLSLKIKDDEPRRRIIAALNNKNQLLFFVITGQDSAFSGPLLKDTPFVLTLISQKIEENLVSALNLDGGSASAFSTPDIFLEEFSFVASYFCASL